VLKRKCVLILFLFKAFLSSCNQPVQVIQYQLNNLDITDGKFYIRGISAEDALDTFTQGFIIVEKSEEGCCDHPKAATYRAHMFQGSKIINHEIIYDTNFYVTINKRQGDYFDVGKEYWFKCSVRRKDVIDLFKRENCSLSYNFYYLKLL
jgi:hypothetical protein